MEKFAFYFLIILPFAQCNLEGLNIRLGTCPAFTAAPNLVLRLFTASPWTVSQRSTDFYAGATDCETQLFVADANNNLRVTYIFTNSRSEIARAYSAGAVLRAPGIFRFLLSLLRDNYMLKGDMTVLATDNTSFALTVQCFELFGYRFIIVFVLIKGTTPPPNLEALIAQAVANNNNLLFDLNFPIRNKQLETRCQF